MTSLRLSSLIFNIFALGATAAVPQNLRGNPDQSGAGRHLAADSETISKSFEDGATVRSTTITYFLTSKKHKIRDLCWPGNTEDNAITKYEGRLCSDGHSIIYDSMKTVANENSEVPIVGADGKPCEWSRSTDAAWNAEWLGSGCGDSADALPLPRHLDDTKITQWGDYKMQSENDLPPCLEKPSNINVRVKFESTMCPDDHTKRMYTAMIATMDTDMNTARTCTNGLKAIWSRHDYDPVSDAQFIKEYFGDCGNAPTMFPELKTTA